MDPKTDRRRSRISYRNNRNRSKSAEVSAEVEVNLTIEEIFQTNGSTTKGDSRLLVKVIKFG